MKLESRFIKVAIVMLSFFLLSFVNESGGRKKIKVACVGDSITFGARLENPEKDSYPSQLQLLLGENYQVENFGVGGATLIRKGHPTVWSQLAKIKQSKPDIVIISLGTNDTCGMGTCGDRKYWEYKDEFPGDYRDLIDSISHFSSTPKIWICAPSPMVLETSGLSEERINGLTERKPRLQELIDVIKKLAEEKDLGFIDLNTPLKDKPDLFTEEDGVHPNQAGYKTIAKLVNRELTKALK